MQLEMNVFSKNNNLILKRNNYDNSFASDGLEI